jgi:DNA-directed RNA polymerase subunit RPC12/RpoP
MPEKSIVAPNRVWDFSSGRMSEFKFACPVCGQHITADSSTSGAPIQCPTCFQKILVPQAPATKDAKFILSATQVTKPRTGFDTSTSLESVRRTGGRHSLTFVALIVVLLGGGAALFLWAQDILKLPGKEKVEAPPKTVHPLPTNIIWTMDLTNAAIPEETVAGSVHGNGFLCERAIMRGGTLSLRQGKTWPPDLGVAVVLPAPQAELLSGKTILVGARRPPPVPKVLLRWKNEQEQPVTKEFTSGYVLKLVFGQATNGRMPGQIYIGFPDDHRSFAAGTFEAEIRKAPTSFPEQPQPPKNLPQ